MKSVFFIFVNYNSRDKIYNNITRMINEKNKSFNCIFFIVDNSGEILNDQNLKKLDHVHIIGDGTNIGYCGGNNLAYKHIINSGLDGDVVICNPDTMFCLSQIEMLLGVVTEWGVYTLPALSPEGKVLYTGISLDGFKQKICKNIKRQGIIESDYCPGSFLFLKCDNKKNLKILFDEDFFMYWEEVDLCLNIRKIGGKCCFVHGLGFVTRAENAPGWLDKASYYYLRNCFLMWEKHKDVFSIMDVFLFLSKSIAIFTFKALKNKSYPLIINSYYAIRDGFEKNYGMNSRR